VDNKKRFFSVLLLIAIYAFAIGVSVRSHPPLIFNSVASNEYQSSLSPIQSPIYYHTAQVDISGKTVNTLPSKDFKIQLEELVAFTNAFEFLTESENTQYTKFAINLLINYRKTDLIFPFHYFW
jgi:hypothetical protein